MTFSHPSQEASPPPPVSSLRSKFEQIAAAAAASSSSSPPHSLSPSHPPRKRASSNADLRRQQQIVESKRVVSGMSDALGVPSLRSSPSSPDLNSIGTIKPPPLPPKGSRTPSPHPPASIPPAPPPRAHSVSNASLSLPSQASMQKKSAPLSRRPPPPPPAKLVAATVLAEDTTPSLRGVASLKSKFNGNDVRSISVSIPPALPARSKDGVLSSIKGPRASLPGLATFASDPLLPLCDNALSRPPPPVPSRSNNNLTSKVANSITRRERTAERASIDASSSSTDSLSSSENGASESPKPGIPPRPRTSPCSPKACPPPLPPRRNQSDEAEEKSSAGPPPLPRRRSFEPSVPAKPLSRTDGFAPPPARVIGLKDKLPPARRPPSDTEDSDVDPAAIEPLTASGSGLTRAVEDLPDSTHCSRRPPLLPDYKFARARVHVAALSSVVAVSGPNVVVSSHHHLKIYDLTIGDVPVFTTDVKDLPLEWRVKDPRVTAMNFRAGEGEESGNFLWCGSKDGHLWEFDIARCAVVRVRNAAHGYAVINIMRHGRSMITLDESGKVLVWNDYQDLNTGGQPRIARVADKQGFVKMLGGLLWTSNGPGNGGAATGAQRTPAIRVYDILSPNCTAKIITPPEALGAVTSGTILPSQRHLVYLGHEGGYITSWATPSLSNHPDTFDSGHAVPACIQVVKISASDVLALEGVVDRLWVCGRKGTISAYDLDTKPWTMTNSWQAHEELPVVKLAVDPLSIDKCQRLHVVSVGRDEVLRFWDGLLGADWVENELHKREEEFNTFRDVKILMCSWNTDAQKPDQLTGSIDNVNFLETVLHSVDSPDIIVFGFQELIDLENHKLTAKTVLLGGQKKKTDGSISEKVSRSYRMWHERLVQAVRLAMPIDNPYVVAHTDSLVGLFSCIFVRQRQRHLLRDSAIATVKRGMGGRYGNKGAIVARFVIDDSSLCFINCHLAAGLSHVRSRNRDVAAILEDGAALPRSDLLEALPYVGGGDGTMILDHEICFLGGDLNYRIELRRDAVISAVKSGDLEYLLNHDQLRQQAKSNPGFRLRSFVEAPISFAPTYKYDRRSSTYDSSEKSRAPAWCDRILYRCRDLSRVQVLHYRRYEANVSDHRPISAAFRVTVKSIRHEARAAAKTDIEVFWRERSLGLLFDMREFYSTKHIL